MAAGGAQWQPYWVPGVLLLYGIMVTPTLRHTTSSGPARRASGKATWAGPCRLTVGKGRQSANTTDPCRRRCDVTCARCGSGSVLTTPADRPGSLWVEWPHNKCDPTHPIQPATLIVHLLCLITQHPYFLHHPSSGRLPLCLERQESREDTRSWWPIASRSDHVNWVCREC